MRILTSAFLCLLLSTLATAERKHSQVFKLFEVSTVDSISHINKETGTFCQPLSNPKLSKRGIASENRHSCSHILETLQFIGFHGTTAINIDSIQNGITVFDPKNPIATKKSTPVHTLRHGPSFYVTDSIMAVRYFQKAAYQNFKNRKFSDGECEPSLCGVFMSKETWSEIPKVYFRPFKRTDDGDLKFIWYDQDETDKAIVEYMEQKGITKKPLIFSPVFRLEGWKMQVAVPSDHTDKLVALCTRDSLAHQLWERYPEDIGRQPVNLVEETEASAGRLFGSHFEGMLDLNYWSRMKIHEGINKDDSGRNERDGEQIELDTIGEGSMPPSD